MLVGSSENVSKQKSKIEEPGLYMYVEVDLFINKQKIQLAVFLEKRIHMFNILYYSVKFIFRVYAGLSI